MDYFGLVSYKLRKVVVCGEPLHLPNKVVNLPLQKGRGTFILGLVVLQYWMIFDAIVL